jgi:hypothetical protein
LPVPIIATLNGYTAVPPPQVGDDNQKAMSGEIPMRKYMGFVFLLLVSLFANPANPETSGTNLILTAHWDNQQAVQGTVTLVKANLLTENNVVVAKPLVQGVASVNLPLAGNAIYNVTLLEKNGKELLKFPITTALINPKNLASGEIEFVFREKDQSVESARVNVLMNF